MEKKEKLKQSCRFGMSRMNSPFMWGVRTSSLPWYHLF